MQHFDLEQLRTFVAVTEAGSFTAGAPRVFLSQSAVSEQLRKLEERAGQPLLWRAKSGVTPTAAGERLLAHARRLLAMSEAAWRDLRDVTLQGELRLAVTDYFRPTELSRLLARLNEQHPDVRLHVSMLKSDEIDAAYARGEFDVGLTMRLAGTPAAAKSGKSVLRREALAWMAAPGVRPVRGQPLRLLALPETCSLRQFTVGLLTRRRVAHDVVHVASGVAGLQSALAAGLGVACLNESSLCLGIVRIPEPHGLPALPRAAFYLLPARGAESDFIKRARELLAAHFA